MISSLSILDGFNSAYFKQSGTLLTSRSDWPNANSGRLPLFWTATTLRVFKCKSTFSVESGTNSDNARAWRAQLCDLLNRGKSHLHCWAPVIRFGRLPKFWTATNRQIFNVFLWFVCRAVICGHIFALGSWMEKFWVLTLYFACARSWSLLLVSAWLRFHFAFIIKIHMMLSAKSGRFRTGTSVSNLFKFPYSSL